MNRHLGKQRATDDILVGSRTYGIQPHSTDHIPSRHLPLILVPTITVRTGIIQFPHHLSGPFLRFPGFTGIIIKIDHMMNRLISMGILSHIDHHHLGHLMNHPAVSTHFHRIRNRKDRIQFRSKIAFASHQVDQALNIVHHRPVILPGISFDKRSAPSGRIEIFLSPFSIRQASPHKPGFRIVNIPVVEYRFTEKAFVSLVPHFLSQAHRTKIVIGILQGFGCRLAGGTERDISFEVIISPSRPPDRLSERGLVSSIVMHRLQGLLRIEGTYPLHPSICQ